ncbi:MAG: hypothetical protein FWE13_06655 [Firmicutes bacterium]|nr:hypothetical protein [Bacillota bacterium]
MKITLGNKLNKNEELEENNIFNGSNQFCDSTLYNECIAQDTSIVDYEKTIPLNCDKVDIQSKVLLEDISLRTPNAKFYGLDGKIVSAAFSSNTIHYLNHETGKLEEINNTLIDTGDYLETVSNNFLVRFNKYSINGQIFTISKDNCTATLFSNEVAAYGGCALEQCSCEESHSSSRVILRNVVEQTDFEYIVDSHRVKENIIVHKKFDNYEYNFILKLDNLSIDVSDDKKMLQLKSIATGEIVFTIPAPFMTDADNQYSDKVYYEITSSEEGKLNIKVIADSKWINAKERAFPIKIDPQIQISNSNVFSYDVFRQSRGSGTCVECGEQGSGCGHWQQMHGMSPRAGTDGTGTYRTRLRIHADFNWRSVVGANIDLRDLGGQVGRFIVSAGGVNTEVHIDGRTDTAFVDISAAFTNLNTNTDFIEVEFLPHANTNAVLSVRVDSLHAILSPVTNLRITHLPTRRIYQEEEVFDSSGMIIQATHANGVVHNVPRNSNFSGGYNIHPLRLSANTTFLTITFGKSISFERFAVLPNFRNRIPAANRANMYNLQLLNEQGGAIASRPNLNGPVRLELTDGASVSNQGTPLNAETLNSIVNALIELSKGEL